MGRLCAEVFDKLIIRRGDYLRGRSEEEVFRLITGRHQRKRKKSDVEIIRESKEAIFNAFDNAQKGELVVILADTVSKDIDYGQSSIVKS